MTQEESGYQELVDSSAAGPHSRLRNIALSLESNEAPQIVTARELIEWFGAYKRSYALTNRIRHALNRAGLRTVPDFEDAYLDAALRFELVAQSEPSSPDSPVEAEPSPARQDFALPSIGLPDPTHRIGKLAAANRRPLSIAPNATVQQAVTLLLAHDYSQLPIMVGDRNVKGVISWKSIGSKLLFAGPNGFVKDYCEAAVEVSTETSLFHAIPFIAQYDYALVRDNTQAITGIVTTADLSEQFRQLSEPFLLIGEIENHVRRLIDGRFTKTELLNAKHPESEGREIEGVADLTFGEYIHLLQKPLNWSKLAIPIDSRTFLYDLEAVRLIRNDVMHFDPDPIPETDLIALRRIAAFMRTIHALRVSA